MSDQDNFSLQSQFTIKQTSNKDKEKYQVGNRWYQLIQYQILQTIIIGIVWQKVRKITNEILRVKGLSL